MSERTNGTFQDCIDNGYRITAWCPQNHSAQLDLAALAARLGPDHSTMRDVLLPKLRCSTCGAKAITIIFSPVIKPRVKEG